MARFEILIKRSAAKELEAIPNKKDRQRIVDPIRTLADDPRPSGCRKLTGLEQYRFRQGRYRIVYSIEDDRLVIVVVRIAHRKNANR